MALAFDHLVYFTDKKLEHHINELRHQGLHAKRGGSHKSWGTYNALCYFGLSYIEFLAVENEQIAQQASENPLVGQLVKDLPMKQGPGQFAIRTPHIEKLKQQLEEKGLETVLFPGRRLREDGTELNWKLLFIKNQPDGLLLPPFFIDWLVPDNQRYEDLKRAGLIDGQSTVEMDHVKLIVKDADETAQRWNDWFGIPVISSYHNEDLHAQCTVLALDDCELHFCSPAGEGRAKAFLGTMGERTYEVVLNDGKALR